ncbi:MAG: translocation/assembly module TamB domain-containing protein [Chitinophagaceae bacterium]
MIAKKFFNILGAFLLSLIGLILLIAVLINIPVVQNWLVKKITTRLAKELNTTVQIRHIDFNLALFNKMVLEGTLVKDHLKDTLLYAGKVNVRVTDWFFLQDTIVLKYIGLEDATVKMHRVDSVWNYKFLIDYFSGGSSGKKKSTINLDLKVVELDNINFSRKDEWRGENMVLHLRSMDLVAREINMAEKNIAINSINLAEPYFSIYNYPGRRPPRPPAIKEYNGLVFDTALKWNPDGWNMSIRSVTVSDGIFRTGSKSNRQPYYYFDGQNIAFSQINSTFNNISFKKDTLSANVLLSTRERSGFVIKSLSANLKMQPQGMEFASLDIQTNKSRLRNYFSLTYNEFNDMSDFIEKVKMEGVFKNSELESDDIAFFAPDVKSWKKRIFIAGNVKGTITNLSSKNLVVRAGNNTFLKGDLKIVGLPVIDKTFIDFKANEFRTTYADAVAFIPRLKKIDDPRIDRLQHLQFKGYFTGFMHDFVTYGTLQTTLGTVVVDANMRLSPKGATTYSGKIATAGFDIGRLLDNRQLGRIAFKGTLAGNGFNYKAMQANLDGNVQSIDFNNYRYSNIKVKGQVAKKLFNGDFVVNDTNLSAHLTGLVDLSKAEPRFDFTAVINKSNLKKLKLYKDDVDFNGNLLVNFTGSTIDEFEGLAKISNASVYKDGQRISFDSLSVESKRMGTSKSIEVLSNEMHALLVGEFSIKELPDAFQIFLNRYYPNYINPSRRKLTNENFSFVVTTKKIDDYLRLLNPDLKGFNFSSVSGRINLLENLFDLDAEVPEFSYKNISFFNVDLKGRGNLDTLALNGKVGDVFVNDSLHFPGTEITIQSSQDLSKVNITTSANQTLNAANISGQVYTMKNGVRILFNPSTFDINGKKWTIDKDGELILSKELVTTEGIRIYNEDQEIFINSVPSSIGNSTDLTLALKKINIGDFTPFFTKDYRLEGLLSGTVDLLDPFGDLHVDIKAEANQFRLDDDSLGTIRINSDYSRLTGKINASVISNNEHYNFDLNAVINVLDSAKENIDLGFNLRNTSIHLLGKYLSGIFTRLEGNATGNLRVVGPSRNLKYIGDLQLTDGGMMVNYTKCYYKIPSAHVILNDGSIDFGSFTIRDTLNNSAEITTGRLAHHAFKDLVFDFRLRSNQLLLLNTSASDNNQFYGSVIGKVNMSFTGPLEDMKMDIKGEPTDTSNIYLPIGSSRESGDAGFIVWKVYGREMQDQDLKFRESNLTVSLDVTANKFANIFVILDDLTGDIISATGTGNLKVQAGTREDMSMSGRFNIERGNYTFTFQSIKRNFRLREEAGSYISWNGDPTAATIDIEAEYEADNVRFSDLLNGSSLAAATSDENVKRYRGKVLVIATLTESLTKPDIAFRIELPQNSPIRSSQDVATIFSFIENDKNELNKQVSFLILFNTFGPYTGGGANSSGTGDLANKALEGIVVNSISGFLSSILTKEFSDILQNIFKDKSLKVNINASLYSGTNLIDNYNPNQVTLPDRTNFNLSIGKSFFNERLTFIVGGALDFGLTTQQNQPAGLPFLPDVTAEWRLTPDGKFRLTFFYRENYSYLGLGSGTGKQNRSGSSISFRKEFDRIGEMFKKKKRLNL